MIPVIALIPAVLIAAEPTPACVTVQPGDNLSEQERSAARELLAQALRAAGVSAVAADAGCAAGWNVQNLRLGSTISVTVSGPQGTRAATVHTVDDLPALYRQMTRSILSGIPLATEDAARDSVTRTQRDPIRSGADVLFYARVGPAITLGPGAGLGPTAGLGLRLELDRLGIDISGFNFAFHSGDHSDETFAGSIVKIMGLRYQDPQASGTGYLGAGASWGGASVSDASGSYSKLSIQAELAGGYEFLRSSSIRLFVQADVTLPLFLTESAAGGDGKYTPTVGISLGGAFGQAGCAL